MKVSIINHSVSYSIPSFFKWIKITSNRFILEKRLHCFSFIKGKFNQSTCTCNQLKYRGLIANISLFDHRKISLGDLEELDVQIFYFNILSQKLLLLHKVLLYIRGILNSREFKTNVKTQEHRLKLALIS